MKRLLAIPVAALVLAGCSEMDLSPLAPEPPLGGGASFAVEQGGASGAYFLEPLMNSTFAGTFDGERSPEIAICSGAPTAPCATPIAAFDMTRDAGETEAQVIRMVPEDEHYIVNWNTQGVPQGDYRIFVVENGATLAYIDVVVVQSGKAMKDYKGSDLPVINGSLPIKVRIEAVHGLLAEYFDMGSLFCPALENPCQYTFTNWAFVASRIESTISFAVGNGSIWPGVVNNDRVAVRWTGLVRPLFPEEYTFCATSDDGARLWINEELLVDMWVQQAATERCGTIALNAGQKYALRMEYFENFSAATAQLRWQSASQAKEIIPSSAFFLY
ncbi:MAG: hypothetical protein H0W11_05935 [Gemmatimonadetes bacterium]|jgi:hypothetical protein|nr:hypothetical protein [Gemmatimonadota bacterium]